MVPSVSQPGAEARGEALALAFMCHQYLHLITSSLGCEAAATHEGERLEEGLGGMSSPLMLPWQPPHVHWDLWLQPDSFSAVLFHCTWLSLHSSKGLYPRCRPHVARPSRLLGNCSYPAESQLGLAWFPVRTSGI